MITCPLCGTSIDHSRVLVRFGNQMMPTYQCKDCMNKGGATFVYMPEGTMVDARDFAESMKKDWVRPPAGILPATQQ